MPWLLKMIECTHPSPIALHLQHKRPEDENGVLLHTNLYAKDSLCVSIFKRGTENGIKEHLPPHRNKIKIKQTTLSDH